MEQACRTGWSVEESVSRLKHLHYLLKRLSEIFTKRIPCEPIYELKSAYSLHAYLCAEQVTLLRKRVGEMREPPLGLEHVPHAALKLALDELEFCPNTRDFVTVAYSVIIPHALARCNEFMEQAHPLADAPTVRIAKLIDFELTPLQEFGLRASQCLAQAAGFHTDKGIGGGGKVLVTAIDGVGDTLLLQVGAPARQCLLGQVDQQLGQALGAAKGPAFHDVSQL